MNVLVYAFDRAAHHHERYRTWVEAALSSGEPFGVSELTLTAFIRIASHRRILVRPARLDVALGFAAMVRGAPNAVVVAPGTRHWDIFTGLCRAAGATGTLIPDAYLAALAIESGSEWITIDRDFSRFPGLRWRHPLGS